MTEAVSLRIHGGLVKVSSVGLELIPWFRRHGVVVEWDNVMCVSPIPFSTKVDGEWKTFRDEPLTSATLQGQVKFYAFQVAVNDRQRVFVGTSFFMRLWLLLSVWLKPLYVEEDKPHHSNGCIELSLRKGWVRKSAPSLLSAMDLLGRYAKFDHLGSW
jgi:hypothetical protein